MAAIGHPIVGDLLYGEESNKEITDTLNLHAFQLEFNHPKYKTPMKLSTTSIEI